MSLVETVTNLVNAELDKAESIWKEVEDEFIAKSVKAFSLNEVDTNIPGHEIINVSKPEVGNFIALVLDIRGATKHLLQAISKDIAKASQLERVLYETSAINAMGVTVINHYNGSITEFLGDGFLALFKVENHENPKEVYEAHRAAAACLTLTNDVVNIILKDRYELPPLKIGIGMAYSKAIVTVVGSEQNLHPKVIGECVYRASKLSDGFNQIIIDERLKLIWPQAKDGKVKFDLISSKHDFKSYKMLM